MKNVAAAVSGRVQEKCGEPTESPAWDPQRGVFRALPQSRKGFEGDFLQHHVSRNPLTRTPCQVGPQSTKVSIGISCSVMSPETIWPAHPAELGAAKSAARVAKFPITIAFGIRNLDLISLVLMNWLPWAPLFYHVMSLQEDWNLAVESSHLNRSPSHRPKRTLSENCKERYRGNAKEGWGVAVWSWCTLSIKSIPNHLQHADSL